MSDQGVLTGSTEKITPRSSGIASAGASAARPTVSSVVEKLQLSGIHYFLVIASALGYAFDSFDTYIVSFAMPSIVKEWNITPVQNGYLTSAGMWGMFLGAMAWGPLTDRFGRKFGFSGTVLGFSLLCGITALVQDTTQFMLLRFVTGIFLGGMIPVVSSLVAEYIAAGYRGRFVATLTVLWPSGLIAAAIAAMILVPTYGWRALFLVGVIPALLALIVIKALPESPRWLATKGRLDEAARVLKRLGATDADVKGLEAEKVAASSVGIGVLLRPPYLSRFILAAGTYFFGYFGYYGFVLWIPSILAVVFKISLVKTFTYTMCVGVSAILGKGTAFYTIEKFGRKQLFYIGYGLGGVASLIFGLITDPGYLVFGACAVGYFLEMGVAGTVVWPSELFPSHVRATANCWASGIGKLSSALSPIVFGYFMANQMYYYIFVTMFIFLCITCALVFFLGIETKGKSLNEVGAA